MPTLKDLASKMTLDWERRISFDPDFWMAERTSSPEEFAESGIRDIRSLLYNLDYNLLSTWSALEYGCGSGRITQSAGRFFNYAKGVDISDVGVQAARARTAEQKNVRIEKCDGISLSSEPEKHYNLIFSYAVLSHLDVSVLSALLREFNRVLKDGGIIRLQLFSSDTTTLRIETDTLTARGYSSDCLIQGLKAAGFSEVVIFSLQLPFDASFENSLFPVVVSAKKDAQISVVSADGVIFELSKNLIVRNDSFIECSMLYDQFNYQVKNRDFDGAEKTLQYLFEIETRDEKIKELTLARGLLG